MRRLPRPASRCAWCTGRGTLWPPDRGKSESDNVVSQLPALGGTLTAYCTKEPSMRASVALAGAKRLSTASPSLIPNSSGSSCGQAHKASVSTCKRIMNATVPMHAADQVIGCLADWFGKGRVHKDDPLLLDSASYDGNVACPASSPGFKRRLGQQGCAGGWRERHKRLAVGKQSRASE